MFIKRHSHKKGGSSCLFTKAILWIGKRPCRKKETVVAVKEQTSLFTSVLPVLTSPSKERSTKEGLTEKLRTQRRWQLTLQPKQKSYRAHQKALGFPHGLLFFPAPSQNIQHQFGAGNTSQGKGAGFILQLFISTKVEQVPTLLNSSH